MSKSNSVWQMNHFASGHCLRLSIAVLMPLSCRYINILSLPLVIDDRRFMRSQWGERRTVDIYRLDLGIGEFRLPAVQIIGDDQGDEVILGRNVLNMLRIYLDGPKQVVTLSD
jgi:hypothetical protein